MQGFTYKYGDRPLEGYTIQRAAGRGGFGEVYYALSDSGREVALKVVQGYEAIELRGISQCMNLKSPHLVTIFDVKYNEAGKPFVLMEYVAGPSLRDLLDQSPAGLGSQKTAFFLREMAKGLTYLHDRGIVHRDLKPGNVFYEDGYVKIGDYGLSKAISASRHSGQTITVGTVHYMAPEIGRGSYDRSIDIYALGCVVYEMLTGQTPYLGGSPGEILMKHMMDQPDLSNIEEPFATVIRKALAKDPKDRFQTVQEMVEAVFGASHIQQSVSCFSPDSLTMVAGRVAQKVATGGSGSSGRQPGLGGSEGNPAGSGQSEWFDRFGQQMEQVEQRIEAAGNRLGDRLQQAARGVRHRWQGKGGQTPAAVELEAVPVDPGRDPLPRAQRLVLALATMLIVGWGATVLGTNPNDVLMGMNAVAANSLMLGAFLGSMIVAWKLPKSLADELGSVSRVIAGLVPVATGLLFGGLIIALYANHSSLADKIWQRNISTTGTAIAALLPLLCLNWLGLMAPDRRQRLSLKPALFAGVLALLLAGLLRLNTALAMGVAAGVSLAIQVACPFDPLARRVRAVKAPAGRASGSNRAGDDPPRYGREGQPQPGAPHGRQSEQRYAWQPYPQGPDYWPGPERAGVWTSGGYRLLPSGISPQKRMWALVLAAPGLWGLGGLHRFYVGKIWTGLLWLCTGGLFGVGQIIDAIMILSGNFRDKHGRRVVVWTDYNEVGGGLPVSPARQTASVGQAANPAEQAPAGQQGPSRQVPADDGSGIGPVGSSWTSQSVAPRRLTNPFLSFLGWVILLVTALVGVVGAVALQFLMMVGAASEGGPIKEPWQKLFNGDWLYALQPAHTIAMSVLVLLAAVLFILARRRAGGGHIVRGVAGSLGILASLWVLRIAIVPGVHVFRQAYEQMQQHHPDEVLRILLNAVQSGGLLMAGFAFLVGIILLAWPAKTPRGAAPVGEGV